MHLADISRRVVYAGKNYKPWLHNFNPKTDFREIPASKNTNALTALLTRSGFFSQKLTQTSAKAQVLPVFYLHWSSADICDTAIMPIIGVSDTVSSYRGASAWSHSLHREAGTSWSRVQQQMGRRGEERESKLFQAFCSEVAITGTDSK